MSDSATFVVQLSMANIFKLFSLIPIPADLFTADFLKDVLRETLPLEISLQKIL